MTITNEQVVLFSRLFTGRTDVYGTYDPATKRVRQIKAPVTNRVIADHLLGRRPYGVYLLQGEIVSAAAVDFDQEEGRPPAEFVRRMANVGIPAYIERSKSKGYHAWVFFVQEGVKARMFRAIARNVLSEMGCSSVEIFPKQDALTTAASFGNFINAPIFGTLAEQGRTVFVDPNFVPFPDQWKFLTGIRRVTPHELEAACSRIGCPSVTPSPSAGSLVSSPKSVSYSFSLRPCARRMLTEGVTANQRTACFRLACQLRKTGLPYEYALTILTSWAQKNRPSDGKGIISIGEVTQQAQYAFRGRLYLSCGCAEPSVQAFCDPACPLRKRQGSAVAATPEPQAIRD